jgi:glutamyl-tRNA reductase
MALIVAGVNHLTAPIEIREKLAYGATEIEEALSQLKTESGAREAVVLSTCNRTEFWLVETTETGASAVASLMSQRLGANVAPCLYVRETAKLRPTCSALHQGSTR